MSPQEIIDNGLPIDYFDDGVIDLKCKFDSKSEQWLKKYVGQITKK